MTTRREPIKLPWLVDGLPAAVIGRRAKGVRRARPSAVREMLPDVLAGLGVNEPDPGLEATLAAFRRRHGIGLEVRLTPQMVDAALRARAQERERSINEFLGGA